MPSKQPPKIFIGVPTGPSKEYAVLYMLAALRNVDYPKNRLSINFAVTDFGDAESSAFIKRLKELLSAGNFGCETSIQMTHPIKDDWDRWGPYFTVILNLHLLRLKFLRGNADYFWLLGGDNPPPRGTLKRLLETRGDIVSANINQRVTKAKEYDLDCNLRYPVYWRYIWTLDDLEYVDGLEPKLKNILRNTWVEFMFLDTPPPKPDERVIHNCVFGSGCSLVKRKVLEYIGYALGSGGTHSEDLHFCSLANLREFDTALNLDARCGHFDEDGKLY